MPDKVAEAAWAAVREQEARERLEREKQERRQLENERRQQRTLVQKHRHLLDDSVLSTMFPTLEWTIERASDTWKGPNGAIHQEPTLIVHEKGADPHGRITFRIDEHGTYIDWTDEYDSYGQIRREPCSTLVESVEDIGRVLKRKSEIMNASYRRNPD